MYNLKTKIVDRYSTVAFDETRKGGTLLDPSRNQDALRLEEEVSAQAERSSQEGDGDTIVVQPSTVRSRSPEPQEDSDEDTIVVRPYGPQRNSGRQPAELERIESAGETTTERQSRSGRPIRMPARYEARQTVTSEVVTPTSYEDAVSGPQKKQWEAAINDELRSLILNNVWELAEALKGVNIVSCK